MEDSRYQPEETLLSNRSRSLSKRLRLVRNDDGSLRLTIILSPLFPIFPYSSPFLLSFFFFLFYIYRSVLYGHFIQQLNVALFFMLFLECPFNFFVARDRTLKIHWLHEIRALKVFTGCSHCFIGFDIKVEARDCSSHGKDIYLNSLRFVNRITNEAHIYL